MRSCVLHEERADLLRIVPAELGDARGEVGHHVRMRVERAVHPVDVLRVVGEMDADERRLRMPRDHAVERGQQFLARRIFRRIAEPPATVILQLRPALVLVIVRQPEGARIGDVDRHRHPQFAALRPDRIELRIVDLDQLALAVACRNSPSRLYSFSPAAPRRWPSSICPTARCAESGSSQPA